MNIKNFIEIAGWCGMVAILLAYGLLSYGTLSATSFLYNFINLTGATALIISCFYKRDYAVAVLNVCMASIAIFAILRPLFA